VILNFHYDLLYLSIELNVLLHPAWSTPMRLTGLRFTLGLMTIILIFTLSAPANPLRRKRRHGD